MLTLQYPQSNFHLSFLANIISGINGTFENLRLSQNKIQYKLIHSLSIYTYMYINYAFIIKTKINISLRASGYISIRKVRVKMSYFATCNKSIFSDKTVLIFHSFKLPDVIISVTTCVLPTQLVSKSLIFHL